MARKALPRNDFSSVYTELLARAEEESRHSMPFPGNAERLAKLRAGQPVSGQ
jgi:hypothetical protein